MISYAVALRKESVDRNPFVSCSSPLGQVSLSARRAWIEMVITAMTSQISVVALRKESVDRNHSDTLSALAPKQSLSARRAWIEMGRASRIFRPGRRRSPQGERG